MTLVHVVLVENLSIVAELNRITLNFYLIRLSAEIRISVLVLSLFC
jgi:hypothetical protein